MLFARNLDKRSQFKVLDQQYKQIYNGGKITEKWKCSTCGYIHEGPLPADFKWNLDKRSQFKVLDQQYKQIYNGGKITEKWKCSTCGYIHEGPLPADFKFPLCKQPASVFVKLEEAPAAPAKNPYAGTKTEKNLWDAFAGESQARNKYTYFASVAKKAGYEQIAALFLKTAENEKEHAKL